MPEPIKGRDLRGGSLVESVKSRLEEPHQPVTSNVATALRAGSAWLDTPEADDLASATSHRAFGLADGNVGNFLWDGERCYIVDFEDSGVTDPAYEVADLVEHVSVWLSGIIEADGLIATLEFPADLVGRVRGYRRLFAIYWLLMLLPDNPGHSRNPPGSDERQAERLLTLLGSG